jgi:putative membrane protein
MLWVKAFHIVFVASWFAGLFYLPRIFVNLAMVPAGSEAERASAAADGAQAAAVHDAAGGARAGLGLWLWLGYGIGPRGNGWMHAKLAVVLLAIGYHHACAVLLRKLRRPARAGAATAGTAGSTKLPVLLLLAAVVLAVVKPF